jgi:membrane protein implicated in regulation of membrane protease activity
MTWWIVGIFQLLFFLLRQIIDLYFVRRIYIKRERERERERKEGKMINGGKKKE